MRATPILAGLAAGLALGFGGVAVSELATEDAGAQGGSGEQGLDAANDRSIRGIKQGTSVWNLVAKYLAPEGERIGLKSPRISQDAGVGGGLPTETLADGAVTSPKLSADLRQQLQTPGPPGPQGPPGSNASINGVAAGGDLTGTYPNPTLASRSVGVEQLDTPIAARLKGVLPGTELPDGTTVSLPLEEADGSFGTFDTGGFFTPAAPTDMTVPLAGFYRLSATVSHSVGADGRRGVTFARLRGNGSLTLTAAAILSVPGAQTFVVATMQLPAEAGDRLQVRAFQDSGAQESATVQSADLHYLGPLPS